MPDFNVVDLALTMTSIIFVAIFLVKGLLLMDAATTYLKSRTEIEREKFNHDRINGKI